MRIDEKSVQRFEQSKKNQEELFKLADMAEVDQESAVALQGQDFIKMHPGAAALTAVALIGGGAAAAGATGMVSQAAEMDTPADTVVTEVTEGTVTEVTETVETISKAVNFTANGPGHLEAVDNCIIEGNTITFLNPDASATFKVVKDVQGATAQVTINGQALSADTDAVMLEAHSDFVSLDVSFVDVVAQQQAAEQQAAQEAEAARIAAEQEAAARAAAASTSYSARAAADEYTAPAGKQQATTTQKASTAAPASTVAPAATATPAVASTPAPAASNSSAPYSGTQERVHIAEWEAQARAVFDEFNNYRASQGLARLAWSEDCANMAFQSAGWCMANGSLIHGLGIPDHLENNYADILQYSTMKESPQAVVQSWINSTGHRQMMKCSTGSVAGVAAYNDYGTWYYAIVYNFSGTNYGPA